MSNDQSTKEANPGKPTIGFIGLGVMGQSMARNLLHAGYPLHIFTRTKSKATTLIEEGATWCEDPAAVSRTSQVVITMVGYPEDVRNIYFGPSGLIANAMPGAVLIDMTTSSPKLAQEIAAKAESEGVSVLDAPVSGGDIGAREARLSIMVGGREQVFQEMEPIFATMGTNIVLQGHAGAGQHTKMCNQIAIATNMIGVSEALAYAKAAGLNPLHVLKSIETGAAGSWSLSNLAPRMIKGDFAPGFYVKHFIKDMKIAIESAIEMELDLPGLRLAISLYEQLAELGASEEGTQALYKLIAANLDNK